MAHKDHAFYCYLIDHIKYCYREEGEARFAYEESAEKQDGTAHADLFRRRLHWIREVTLAKLMRDEYANQMILGIEFIIRVTRTARQSGL